MPLLRNWLRLALGLAAVTLVLAVSAGAAVSGPLMLAGGEGGGGPEVGGMGPSGVTIRFIDRGRFFVGVLFRNGSSHPLTVVNAHVAEPPHSLVHQVGTRLGLVPPCNAHGVCGSGPTGADAARLRPVALAPGAEVDVQINYQLGSCAEVPHSSLATARVIELSYKDSQGVLQQQTLPIGGGLLHLQKPAGVECVPRPYSHIGLVGSFTTSPGHKPVPGSDGDTCTKSATGRLVFRSRLFTERIGSRVPCRDRVPPLRGQGSVRDIERSYEPWACGCDRFRRFRRPRLDNLPRPPRRRHRHAGSGAPVQRPVPSDPLGPPTLLPRVRRLALHDEASLALVSALAPSDEERKLKRVVCLHAARVVSRARRSGQGRRARW